MSYDRSLFEPLFQQFGQAAVLTEERRTFIASLFIPRAFDKGQFFQRAGEVTTRSAFVSRGCFRTYLIDAEGSEGILHFSPESAWIGGLPTEIGKPTPYFVDAIEASHVLTIDPPSWYRIVEKIPEIGEGYRKALEATFAGKQRRIAMALHSSAEDRYRAFLTRHPSLSERVPLRMLASYLGIAPETLSRIRRRLSETDRSGS